MFAKGAVASRLTSDWWLLYSSLSLSRGYIVAPDTKIATTSIQVQAWPRPITLTWGFGGLRVRIYTPVNGGGHSATSVGNSDFPKQLHTARFWDLDFRHTTYRLLRLWSLPKVTELLPANLELYTLIFVQAILNKFLDDGLKISILSVLLVKDILSLLRNDYFSFSSLTMLKIFRMLGFINYRSTLCNSGYKIIPCSRSK